MTGTWHGYPLTFTWGDECEPRNEWCRHKSEHPHGTNCDDTCQCRTNPQRWRATQ